MIATILAWPWWIWFVVGYIMGFLMCSWLIGHHAAEHEKEKIRMQETIYNLMREMRKATNRGSRPTKDFASFEGFGE
jgi:hypothetical protein